MGPGADARLKRAAAPPPLISLAGCSVAREGSRILHHISWRMHPADNWAVLGPNGSGKSTFLALASGLLWPEPDCGCLRAYCLDGVTIETSPAAVRPFIAHVSAEAQWRYHSLHWDLPVAEAVATGVHGTAYLDRKLGAASRKRVSEVMEAFGLGPHRRTSVLNLSEGQLRRVLMARALAASPRILMMDEAMTSLDRRYHDLAMRLISARSKAGMRIVETAHRASDLLPLVTHTLVMRDGGIVRKGPRRTSSMPRMKTPARMMEAHLDLPDNHNNNAGDVFRLVDVDVYIEGKKRVLADVNWSVAQEQHWAITGPNGSGKSSLLRLLSGDLRPALGGLIERGFPSASVAEIRANLGMVSSELEAMLPPGDTALEVVASGCMGSLGLYQAPGPGVLERASERLSWMGLGRLASRRVSGLSRGELRMVMVGRALVNSPRVLLLDEPAAGLDEGARLSVLVLLDRIAESGHTIIMATHHADELAPCLTHVLRIEEGRIVRKAPLTKKSPAGLIK